MCTLLILVVQKLDHPDLRSRLKTSGEAPSRSEALALCEAQRAAEKSAKASALEAGGWIYHGACWVWSEKVERTSGFFWGGRDQHVRSGSGESETMGVPYSETCPLGDVGSAP